MSTCKFYGRGYCARGSDCRFLHSDISKDANNRHYQAPEVVPLCFYFQRGECRYGTACKYGHSIDEDTASPASQLLQNSTPRPSLTASGINGPISKKIGGATLTFGDGAEITDLELPAPDVSYNTIPLSSIKVIYAKPVKTFKIEFASQYDAIYSGKCIRQHRELFLFKDSRSSVDIDKGLPNKWDDTSNWTLTVKNILAAYGKTDLEESVAPWTIPTWAESSPNYQEDNPGDIVKTLIKNLALRHTPFVQQKVLNPGHPSINQIIFRFLNADDAHLIIRDFNGKKFTELGDAVLRVEPFINIMLTVRTSILAVLMDSFTAMMEEYKDQVATHVKEADPVRGLTVIFLSGSNAEAAAKANTKARIMFAGAPAVGDGKVLWHASLATPLGLLLVQDIAAATNTFIFRDKANFCLRMFGQVENRDHALAMLLGELEVLERPSRRVHVSPREYAACLNGLIAKVKEILDIDSVQVEITKSEHFVILRGREEDFARALDILKIHPSDKSLREGSEGCPVCFTYQDGPVSLSCGHIYCKDCLVSQCDSATSFPLRCVARVGDVDCGQVIAMGLLRTVLPEDNLQKLFESSLSTYIKVRPDDYRNCPTPNCTNIYHVYKGKHKDLKQQPKPGVEAPIPTFHCPTCLSCTCTRCGQATHSPNSCFWAVDVAHGGLNLLKQWKKKNHVHDCPKCKTPIQKSEGCNHIMCAACKIHICWFCMELFEIADACYQHMEVTHAGNGDDQSDLEFEDEDSEEEDDDMDSDSFEDLSSDEFD